MENLDPRLVSMYIAKSNAVIGDYVSKILQLEISLEVSNSKLESYEKLVAQLKNSIEELKKENQFLRMPGSEYSIEEPPEWASEKLPEDTDYNSIDYSDLYKDKETSGNYNDE